MKRLKNIIAVVAVFAVLSGVSAWGEQPGSWQARKEQAIRRSMDSIFKEHHFNEFLF